MSAEKPLIVRSWKVGRYACTMTVPQLVLGQAMHAVFEWDPAVPTRMNPDEWRQYQAGRNQAIAEIAAELSIKIAVLDV